MGKVIHRDLYKKCKFNHKNKWYTHIPESDLEDEAYRFHWDLWFKRIP